MDEQMSLDQRVATLVMEWRIGVFAGCPIYLDWDGTKAQWVSKRYCVDGELWRDRLPIHPVWCPSRNIEHAFIVLDWLVSLVIGKEGAVEVGIGTCGDDWRCEIQTDRWVFDEEGETAGEAICKAALATVAGMDEPWEDDHA